VQYLNQIEAEMRASLVFDRKIGRDKQPVLALEDAYWLIGSAKKYSIFRKRA
jgi:hypothetical protein